MLITTNKKLSISFLFKHNIFFVASIQPNNLINEFVLVFETNNYYLHMILFIEFIYFLNIFAQLNGRWKSNLDLRTKIKKIEI